MQRIKRIDCKTCAQAHIKEIVSRGSTEHNSSRPFWRLRWVVPWCPKVAVSDIRRACVSVGFGKTSQPSLNSDAVCSKSKLDVCSTMGSWDHVLKDNPAPPPVSSSAEAVILEVEVDMQPRLSNGRSRFQTGLLPSTGRRRGQAARRSLRTSWRRARRRGSPVIFLLCASCILGERRELDVVCHGQSFEWRLHVDRW